MDSSKLWTIEVQQADGSWLKLGSGKAWCYASEANALRDLTSKHTKRFLAGAVARPALITEAQ